MLGLSSSGGATLGVGMVGARYDYVEERYRSLRSKVVTPRIQVRLIPSAILSAYCWRIICTY